MVYSLVYSNSALEEVYFDYIVPKFNNNKL